MSLLIIIFTILNLNAAVLKHEVSSPSYKDFNYDEVCQSMGAKHSLLITASSLNEIECFDKTYSLNEFCHIKFPHSKTLTRGYVDKEKKKVVCEMSESVMLSVSCDERDLKYCFKPQEGCQQLKKIYAFKLDIAHYSMLEKNLNCYFSKPIGESLNEN